MNVEKKFYVLTTNCYDNNLCRNLKIFLYQIFLRGLNNVGFVICMGLGLKKVTFHPARNSKL